MFLEIITLGMFLTFSYLGKEIIKGSLSEEVKFSQIFIITLATGFFVSITIWILYDVVQKGLYSVLSNLK